jgi:hypothetical protein
MHDLLMVVFLLSFYRNPICIRILMRATCLVHLLLFDLLILSGEKNMLWSSSRLIVLQPLWFCHQDPVIKHP